MKYPREFENSNFLSLSIHGLLSGITETNPGC